MSATAIQNDPPPPYQQSVDQILAALCTDAGRGLNAEEARRGSNAKVATS